MSILTLLLFIVYSWGIGFSATFFVKNSLNFLERNLMRIGIGLGIMPILGVFLSLINIPLDWKIFLLLSLLLPIYALFRNFRNLKPEFALTKQNLFIITIIILFLATFYMYHKGAFAYPYLEDDDPWSHAVGVKFVSVEKDIFKEETKYIQYINPYPPGYDLVLGILNQTSNSLMWTIKYFNALFISLSILFFYFFVNQLTGRSDRALYSTIVLAALPAFMSHFIWAIALSIPLYFVAFYCLERIKEDKKWVVPSSLVIASSLVLTPTHSTYFALFFILYFIVKTIVFRKLLSYELYSFVIGLSASFLFWYLPMILKYGVSGVLGGVGIGDESVISISGTGDRIYTLADFIVAKPVNMVNSPVGIGILASLLFIVAFVYIIANYKTLLEEKNFWKIITLVWFLFTLYAVNAARFPIKLSSFRTWMLLAIPVSILAGEGLFMLMSLSKSIEKSLNLRFVARSIALILILLGLWFTSGSQKYALNTTPGWPPGAFWTSAEELQGYLWLTSLPPDTKVFSFVNDGVIIGFDKYTCRWCDNVIEFKETAINQTIGDLHSWLKKNDYEYLTIGGQEARWLGVNITNSKVNEMASSELFQPVYQTKGVIVFEII